MNNLYDFSTKKKVASSNKADFDSQEVRINYIVETIIAAVNYMGYKKLSEGTITKVLAELGRRDTLMKDLP